MPQNKVVYVNTPGGWLAGATTSVPKRITHQIEKQNKEGWRAVEIRPFGSRNILIQLLHLGLALMALGGLVRGSGFLVLLEKSDALTQ